MTREESISLIKSAQLMLVNPTTNEPISDLYEALDMAISALNSLEEVYAKGYDDGFSQAEVNYENDKALSQEPCEKQIKIGTKVRTTKDKDFACEKVFPVGTIGIVERIDKGDYLPYKIVANNDYFYYSRDMFEIIEDVEPCTDAVSREAVDKYIVELLSGYLYAEERERLEKLSAYLWELPSVTPSRHKGHWIKDEYVTEPYVCSECGCFYNLKYRNYCPNCGACMKDGRTLDEFIEDSKESEE